jgi:hypothetical protein
VDPSLAWSSRRTGAPTALSPSAKGPLDRPADGHVAPGGEDRLERIVEGSGVIRSPPDLDIGEQAEEGAAPILPAPGRRVIEPRSPGRGRPLGSPRTRSRHTFSGVRSPSRTRAIGSTYVAMPSSIHALRRGHWGSRGGPSRAS